MFASQLLLLYILCNLVWQFMSCYCCCIFCATLSCCVLDSLCLVIAAVYFVRPCRAVFLLIFGFKSMKKMCGLIVGWFWQDCRADQWRHRRPNYPECQLGVWQLVFLHWGPITIRFGAQDSFSAVCLRYDVNKYCCEPACYTVTAVNDLQGSCSWLCTMCLQIYPDIYCSFSKNNILLQDFPSLFTRLPQFYIKFVILMLTTCVSNKKYLCFLQNCSFHRGRFFSATPCTVQKQRSCVITSCLLKPLSLPQCCSYKLSMWCFNFSPCGCYRSVECGMLGSLTDCLGL